MSDRTGQVIGSVEFAWRMPIGDTCKGGESVGQFDRVTLYPGDDDKITRRQRQALRHANDIIKKRFNRTLQTYQGSWEPQTSYSGTTHTDAGVCDLWVPGMDSDEDLRAQVTRVLRREARQAAFLRGPKDKMPWHWHVCDLETDRMDSNAVWQVGQYRLGYNGLSSGVKDRYPYRPKPIVKWKYQEGNKR